MEIPREMLIGLYRRMKTIRKTESVVSEVFKAGKLPGWVHLCIGQEAAVAGACAALRKDDWISPTHRGHGQSLAKGMPIVKMMAEMYGKKTGSNKGRGGSMHLCDLENGILCGNAILGAGLPVAAGAAMSAKLSGSDRVALAFFGEGASSEGIVHETMNLAALWMLPVIFFCESNQFAELSHRRVHLKVESLAVRAEGYGMPGVTVDGNDVIAVYRATTEAVRRAREGGGPTLVDAVTCRLHGHYEGDPQAYRTAQELERARSDDPISRFERQLFADGILDDDRKRRILDEIDREVEAAVRFAESSDVPDPSEASDFVYFHNEVLERQI